MLLLTYFLNSFERALYLISPDIINGLLVIAVADVVVAVVVVAIVDKDGVALVVDLAIEA